MRYGQDCVLIPRLYVNPVTALPCTTVNEVRHCAGGGASSRWRKEHWQADTRR